MNDSVLNTVDTTSSSLRPWYKEGYVWLVIGIPLSAVIVGMIMLWLSIVSFDGLVADDYYKQGMQIDRVLDRERAAADLQLKGELSFGSRADKTQAITLSLLAGASADAANLPQTITVRFSYATSAGSDESFQMTQTSPGQYLGPTLTLPEGRWYVYVGTDDWRLNGVLTTPAEHLVLLSP